MHKKNKDNSGEFDETLSSTETPIVDVGSATRLLRRERKSTTRMINEPIEAKTSKGKRKKVSKSKKHPKAAKSSKQNKSENKSHLTQLSDEPAEILNISTHDDCIYIHDDDSESPKSKKFNLGKTKESTSLQSNYMFNFINKSSTNIVSTSKCHDLNVCDEAKAKKRKRLTLNTSSSDVFPAKSNDTSLSSGLVSKKKKNPNSSSENGPIRKRKRRHTITIGTQNSVPDDASFSSSFSSKNNDTTKRSCSLASLSESNSSMNDWSGKKTK